ncbi:hypothetical protein BsWGS_26909 [Bradybaena similaris]
MTTATAMMMMIIARMILMTANVMMIITRMTHKDNGDDYDDDGGGDHDDDHVEDEAERRKERNIQLLSLISINAFHSRLVPTATKATSVEGRSVNAKIVLDISSDNGQNSRRKEQLLVATPSSPS